MEGIRDKGGGGRAVNNITFPSQEFRLTLVCGFFLHVSYSFFHFPFVLQFLNCGHNMQKTVQKGEGQRAGTRGRGHSIKSSN